MTIFIHPFTLIISGATSSGKTEWLLRLIRNRDLMIEQNQNSSESNSLPSQIHVLYCYGELNPKILALKTASNVELHHGSPSEEIIRSSTSTHAPLLLILDDLYLDVGDQLLNVLFTRGSHNWGVSIILVTQSLFGRNLRTARTNSHYLVLMRNPSGQLEVRNVGSQLFPGRLSYFMDAYRQAIRDPYSYLLVNMAPNTKEEFRLSSHIFPGERMELYLPV